MDIVYQKIQLLSCEKEAISLANTDFRCKKITFVLKKSTKKNKLYLKCILA